MNEQLLALINKLISKLDSMAPNLNDSEEILLASKALQELINTQRENQSIEALIKAVHDLEILINSVDTNLSGLINANDSDINALTNTIDSHTTNFSNPHKITKEQVGLANVNNYGSSDNVEDSSVDKFSTAKAVNVVWNKAKQAIEEAPLDNKNYIRKDKSWVEIETQYKFDSVPIGTIMAFYGKAAPDGYLICDGRQISDIDYPELVAHICGLRQTKFKTTAPISYSKGNWENGLLETDDVKGITWANTNDNTNLNNLSLVNKYITPSNESALVALINQYNDYESTDNESKALFSIANARYALKMIHGNWKEFKDKASNNAIDIYHNISDIELNNSVYLPNLKGQFLRGYDPSSNRELMSSQSDAIRNISGQFGVDRNYAGTVFSGDNMSSLMNVKSSDAETPYLNKVNLGTGGAGWRPTIYFDASKVVPTDLENRPVNLNPLFIIKAKYV